MSFSWLCRNGQSVPAAYAALYINGNSTTKSKMSLFDKITSTIHSKFYFSYSIQRSVWKVLTSLENEQKVVLHSMRTRRVKKANLGVIFWVSLKANSSFKSFQTLSNISSFWSFLLQTLCTFETSHFECPVLHSWECCP